MVAKEYFDLFRTHSRILIVLLSTILLSSTAIGVQRTILSIYSTTLDQSFEEYVILAAAIALGVFGFFRACGSLLGGRYSDRYGRRPISRLGIIVLVVGSITLAFAQNLLVFLIANSIVGLGIGLFVSTANIQMTDLFSQKDRAKAISLLQLSVYLGTSIGSFLAGIAAGEELRLAFVMALGIVVIALTFSIFLKETQQYAGKTSSQELKIREQRILDLKAWWKKELQKYELVTNEEIEELFQELQTRPLNLPSEQEFRFEELTHPSTLVTYSTGIVSRISDATIILIFPLLVLSRGSSTFELGVLTSAFTVFWVIGMAITGPTSDRIGRKNPMFLGLITEMIGILLLISPLLNIFFIFSLFSISLAGFGRGLYHPITSSIIADYITPSHRGQALGVYRFVLDFGYVIGGIIIILITEPIARQTETFLPGIFQTTLIVVVFFLLIQSILVLVFLKDPRPRYSQLPAVLEHLNTVNEGVHHVVLTIFEYFSKNLEQAEIELRTTKEYESKADFLLEGMIERTYNRIWSSSDALEILEFSSQMDKALSYQLRSLRKLLLIKQDLPDPIPSKLSKYVLVLDILLQETVEVLSLLQVQVSLAAEQSYRVNRVEEILDLLHQDLWRTLMGFQEHTSFSMMLITQIIESLEKSANTIEDAAELIRVIAIKHNI